VDSISHVPQSAGHESATAGMWQKSLPSTAQFDESTLPLQRVVVAASAGLVLVGGVIEIVVLSTGQELQKMGQTELTEESKQNEDGTELQSMGSIFPLQDEAIVEIVVVGTVVESVVATDREHEL
jgi:hypothetical protein